MIIDSHHHLWKYSPQQYPWIQDHMPVLQQDYGANALGQIATDHQIDGFVTVQARQTLVENDDLLAIAQQQPLIRGIVGWVPLADPNVGDLLGRYAEHVLIKGVRHVVHDEPDDRFILRADFNRGVRQISSHNLVYDILIFAKHLPVTIQFVDQHPNLPMVLDHIAKPTIQADRFDSDWETNFRELAKRDHVTCKFSALVTEVRDPQWTTDTLRRYWDVAVDAFTPQRLMFGSDWPVCLLRSEYQRWIATVKDLASQLSAAEQADLFANTAIRAYNLSAS